MMANHMRRLLLLPLLLAVAAAVAFAQGDDDVKKLQGTWMLVSGKKDGQPIAPGDIAPSRIVWKGHDAIVETPHQAKETLRAPVKFGTAGSLRTMDWVRTNGPHAGTAMLAIYQFIGPDEYVVVFAPGGKDRPTELDSKPGSGHTMHVWRRVKTP